jgi:MOSC domain-containing protein YiiM
MEIELGKVLSVNVGRPREFEFNGRAARSAIWKQPVAGRVTARGVNFEGPDKAVYAYAVEDLRWYEREIGRAIPYGGFGENLTTQDIEVNDALVGERWQIGSAVFEVSEPRIPCWRLGVRMEDPGFIRRFTEAQRPGAYLRIIVEGEVGAGDSIRIVGKPNSDLTVRDVFRIYTHDRGEVGRLVAVPQMSASWRGWAEHMLPKAGR